MSKAVLISIRPKWCAKIANGEKTIEVRKTRPQIKTPFKCYIYCTKPSRSKMWRAGEYMCFNDDELYRDAKGRIKYGCSIELMACDDYTKDNFHNGKVIGEFVCDRITEIQLTDEGYDFDVPKMTCLKYEEMEAYLGRKNGYGWHISDLIIYNKPKPLTDYMKHPCDFAADCGACERAKWGKGRTFEGCEFGVQRPPQSFMYVEELP